jgi:hypothetical protein
MISTSGINEILGSNCSQLNDCTACSLVFLSVLKLVAYGNLILPKLYLSVMLRRSYMAYMDLFSLATCNKPV